MKNLTIGDLRLGLEDLLDVAKPRISVLLNTATGKFYAPILKRRLAALSALPEARDSGRALTDEMEATDGLHDGYAGAFWDLTGAYLRSPDTSDALRKSILQLRETFMTDGLAEIRANYADEATKAKERIKKLDAHKTTLQSIPVKEGKTLYDWVKSYLENGVKLDELMGKRTFIEASQQEGSRASAGPLRGELIGSLFTMRAALADEKKDSSALPENLDALIFGYFDELQSKRTPSHAPVTSLKEAPSNEPPGKD